MTQSLKAVSERGSRLRGPSVGSMAPRKNSTHEYGTLPSEGLFLKDRPASTDQRTLENIGTFKVPLERMKLEAASVPITNLLIWFAFPLLV